MAVVNESALRASVDADQQSLLVIEDAFKRLGHDQVRIPPVMGLDMPDKNGAIDVKAAYVDGWDSFAIKLSSRFFDNATRGLPTAGGLMVLLDSNTGQVLALLLDNGYLTSVRTALAGALAAKYLAPVTVRTVAVIGSGSQAQWQVRALRLVRSFQRIVCYGPSAEQARDYARHMAAELGMPVAVAGSAEEAIRTGDVIITTTPATSPLVLADWLRPGCHVTAMGSDAPHKNEIAPEVLRRADLLVCDLKSQCLQRGELRHAVLAGLIDEQADIIELGQLVTGAHQGRSTQQQITVCDLTGVGVQDTAIARYAMVQVEASGLTACRV